MTNLPVESVLSEVAEALGAAGRAVLEAPPGSGKTTRVPLGLIEADWLAGRRILMLEPRRLAARAAARYMASLLGEPVGETVGYRVRMDSRVGRHTRVEVVTEGVLTRLLQADPALEAYGLVIFDEFHQRSLQADLGLALCLQSRELLREDLRLLVMSATLDGDAVASFLDDAPVIRAQGRSYPVETRYLPPPANGDLLRHTAAATSRALAEEGGSVLVFLPGVAEIRRVTEWLKSNLPQDVILAPLYGDLSSEAQDQAIRPAPHGRRKVVLATAIAETSLTIEGVRIVIDAGRMRVSRFDPGSGMSRLVTLNVSRAAADQRRGRAGRSAPGVCWRLWSEGQTASLAPATTPEILEADLAPLALELARWGVSDPAELRWLDSPPAGSLAQARDLLVRLAALDRGGRLTAHGEALSELPLHPRLGHMLVRGIARGQGSEACWLAAMLSERDVLAKQAGPRPADMDLRLRHIKEARPRHVSQVAGKLAERLDVRLAPPSTRHTDELLMLAYPDRLAHRRPGSQPRYVLANGRGVRLPEDDALATAEWLAVAHLDGAQREGRIFLAAATSRSRIEDVFADEIEDCEVIEWDDTAEAVVARNERRLGALALQSRVQPHPDPDRTTELLLEAIRRKGLQVLPWTKSAKAWLDRARFAATLAEDASPAMTDEALLGSLEDWLAPFLGGMSRLKHLDKLDLLGALTYRLGPQQSARLDAIAPAKIQLHNNKKFPLDYETGEPVLAVRLQDVFGLAETPRVAEGRMPVTLHLLSPARRPVQITRDLASFWKNGYREVRKEMKGRYPKHEWPESPGA